MHAAKFKTIAISLLAALVTACGGGGGGGGAPAPQDQVISFTTLGTASGAVGTTVTNTAAGGAGTGAISYLSSNINVATVNPTTGVASLISVGSTTITATKAASNGFNQATASYTLNVTRGTQAITFTQPGPLQVLKGFAVTNIASGGAGTGAITYVSSNTAVITVSSTSGGVTAVGAGSAIITATKAADANYSQAQATYTLIVQTQAPVSAWVGSSDSQVTLPSITNGMQFIRSRDRDCNIANFSVCASGQMNTVAGTPINDTAATLTNTGYYWLQSGGAATNALPINVKRFSEREGHTALFFNNRYWVIGGGKINATYAKNDVWSSADGKTWELETSNANFSPRWYHQSVVYNNKMWVIGGGNVSGGIANDVWSSTDGVTWVQMTASLPFSDSSYFFLNVAVFNGAMWAVSNGSSYSSTDGIVWTRRSVINAISGNWRGGASLTNYGGKLWYIGGVPNYIVPGSPGIFGNSVKDVWSSSDGINWTQVTASAPFTERWLHASFVMNNRLWVLGGETFTNGVEGVSTADAWSTTDGITWLQETTSATISRSLLAGVAQETNKVTLIGGSIIGYSNQVWQSIDGNQWTELSPYAQFSPRDNMGVVEFQGDLWSIGGYTGEEAFVSNEIWRSNDGVTWTRVTPIGSVFSPRAGHQALVFNGRLWVIGGWGGQPSYCNTATCNDVWSSADGINWTQHVPTGVIFSPRLGHQAAVFNGKLWIIGGNQGTGNPDTLANDVWSTVDGMSWVQETSSAAFTPRTAHGVVVFNNALWIFGGQNGITASAPLADIWRSTNGVNWSLVTPVGTSFAARSSHAVSVHNNRIWLIGGWNGLYDVDADYLSKTRFNDVWSSTDGINWSQHTPAAQFDARYDLKLVNHNNELWVIGGFNLDLNNEVWRSTDGVNWRVGFNANFKTQ